VTEGRRALLERLGAIESGAECARWLPLLSALADGETTAADVAELRPHLRSCPACRATLREIHAVPAQVALLVPPALVEATTRAAGEGFVSHVELGVHALVDRVTLLALRVQGAFEVLPGAKLAAVAASTAAIAGGGVALERATDAKSASPVSASISAVSGSSRPLSTTAFPARSDPATAGERRTRSAPTARGEFGGRTASSEFPPHAEPQAEFTARDEADVQAPAPATVASSAPSPPVTRASSEFGWP
jgi:Putative zinc-finger